MLRKVLSDTPYQRVFGQKPVFWEKLTYLEKSTWVLFGTPRIISVFLPCIHYATVPDDTSKNKQGVAQRTVRSFFHLRTCRKLWAVPRVGDEFPLVIGNQVTLCEVLSVQPARNQTDCINITVWPLFLSQPGTNKNLADMTLALVGEAKSDRRFIVKNTIPQHAALKNPRHNLDRIMLRTWIKQGGGSNEDLPRFEAREIFSPSESLTECTP